MNQFYVPRTNLNYSAPVQSPLNEKIIDYYEGKRCTLCSMIMDVGEKGSCKYCRGDF